MDPLGSRNQDSVAPEDDDDGPDDAQRVIDERGRCMRACAHANRAPVRKNIDAITTQLRASV